MKKPFNPNKLPIHLDSNDMIQILKLEAEARVKIERYNQMLKNSVIQKEILMMFSMNESIQSTKIEGTQATFDDVMESEVTGEKKRDVQEVLNYLQALYEGSQKLERLPLCTRLFLEVHQTILRDSRGQNRSPGEYRKIQNFIGPNGKIEDASYIPPEPNKVNEYMSNLEEYINGNLEDSFGPLSRAAIVHAQFETIHPFLDGNGRLGRILIVLYFLTEGIIDEPSFFISEELEKNKYKYYSLLNNLRIDKPKWKEWIIFFLHSAMAQADYYIQKLQRIEYLYSDLSKYAQENAIRQDIITYVFSKPIFTAKDLQASLNISYNTARNNLHKLVEGGRIFADDKKRNKIYRFYDFMDIIR
jgi:Fic family protein